MIGWYLKRVSYIRNYTICPKAIEADGPRTLGGTWNFRNSDVHCFVVLTAHRTVGWYLWAVDEVENCAARGQILCRALSSDTELNMWSLLAVLFFLDCIAELSNTKNNTNGNISVVWASLIAWAASKSPIKNGTSCLWFRYDQFKSHADLINFFPSSKLPVTWLCVRLFKLPTNLF